MLSELRESQLRTPIPQAAGRPSIGKVGRPPRPPAYALLFLESYSKSNSLGRLDNQLDDLAFCSYDLEVVTWDEQKQQANLRSHGLDFEGCESVFDHPVVTKEDARMAYGEQRINLLGWLRDRVVHMTYTERGENLHVISLREATKHEVRYYFKAISDEA